jgi:3-dehydroquinate synthase
MHRLTVDTPSRRYDVCIGRGLLDQAGELLQKVLPAPRRVCLAADDRVWELWGARAEAGLRQAGYTVDVWRFPHGETSKTPATALSLVEYLSSLPLTRTDCVVALGGGVAGDLAGFAAAVYLRGIPVVQLPTTLLAAVDSSVGGKTGVDLPAGKNLLGAFHQPSLVVCDPDTLDTLPPAQLTDGCAEVIKYGVIGDRSFFYDLSEPISRHMEAVIARCVRMKRDIVAGDERDLGARQLLNLGHTIGHAVEKLAAYTLGHGSCVAIGMAAITRAAVRRGLCPEADLKDMLAMLEQYGLPTACPYEGAALLPVIAGDKKRAGSAITLVVPHGIGDTRLVKVPLEELAGWLRDGLEGW